MQSLRIIVISAILITGVFACGPRFVSRAEAQPYLSDLRARAADPLFATYAAPLSRSQFIVDQGYHFEYYRPEKGANFITQAAGSMGIAFRMADEVRYTVAALHSPPVVTASYGDLVRYTFEPFADIRVDVHFQVYSSNLALQDIRVTNLGDREFRMDVFPLLRHTVRDVRVSEDQRAFFFRHDDPPDQWTINHDMPHVTERENVFLLSRSPDDAGTLSTSGEEDEALEFLLAALEDDDLDSSPLTEGSGTMAFRIGIQLAPNASEELRVVRGVVDPDESTTLRDEAESLFSYDTAEGLAESESLYERIPKLSFDDPAHEATYWQAFTLVRQVMLPPEGESSYDYYVFSREPTWGWGHGGQVFHESLTMLAYVFMDPESAMNSQRVYMERQHEDGYINYRTGSYLNEVILTEDERTTSAPWYNWINWELFRQTRDREFLEDAYTSGVAFYEWWLRNRDQDGDGLAEWGAHAVLESVRDGKVAVWDDVGWPSNFEAVDLNSMLVMEAKSLAAMADALGDSSALSRWEEEASRRSRAINETFWDEESGFYYNVDRDDHDFSFEEPGDLKRQEIIGFLPLWAGVSTPQHTTRLVDHLTNPAKFWRANGVPSLAADDPYYEPMGYWNGPVWVEWQYLIFRGLLGAGMRDEAEELARRVIDHVAHHLADTHTFWELYNPDELEAGHHQTYIWTALVARMMLDLQAGEFGSLYAPFEGRSSRESGSSADVTHEASGISSLSESLSNRTPSDPSPEVGRGDAASLLFDTSDGLRVQSIWTTTGELSLASRPPLLSFLLNDEMQSTADAVVEASGQTTRLRFGDRIVATVEDHIGSEAESPHGGTRSIVRFTNTSDDTLTLENVVPFGAFEEHVYITAEGPWSLARTRLYRPGRSPIGVILPDNAWEMGYASVEARPRGAVAAIARRTASNNAEPSRWNTLLAPGGSVTYTLYVDAFEGPWQNGLRLMFRDRYLYDLEYFDESLYAREDLSWIRHAYVAVLQAAWDRKFYDEVSGEYVFDEFLTEGERLLGGYDVYALWPTWPRLGLDPRNQWDHYRDLPGGLDALAELAAYARSQGTRFFISYNPWDQSTRSEDHYKGMASLVEQIGVDGVVLDTRGSSSRELQAAADSVRDGVIMYSEGMAVPKDMPGIIAGRVHDAIERPPPLNLNKLIRPEFAIFRVAQLAHETLHRDVATSFFNGYGVEINTFRPSRPPHTLDDYAFLGRAARILRLNSDAFHNREWTPLVASRRDSIWINEFPGAEKTLYAVFSLVPGGHQGPLFPVEVGEDRHFVDLWNHAELDAQLLASGAVLPLDVEGFDARLLHTQEEGAIAAVAALPRILDVRLTEDTLRIKASRGDSILVWAGVPSYEKRPHVLPAGARDVKLYETFGPYQGKFVVELLENGQLLDERVVTMEPGTARLIASRSEQERTTAPRAEPPLGMVRIPGATIAPTLKGNGANGTGIMHYPERLSTGEPHSVDAFFIDRYPVTNAEFKQFVEATAYTPEDASNFLRHWDGDEIPAGLENHPVVNVSLDDAKAYARWAGKRLPTELEWQLAAQGQDDRQWPWGNVFDSTRVNTTGSTTPVDAYPQAESPYGVRDLVGNVWQLTSDVYSEGDYRFVMIRGGSFYHPTSSWWYMNNGPRPLNERQVLLLVSPGFDRSPTVGFRCAADAAGNRSTGESD